MLNQKNTLVLSLGTLLGVMIGVCGSVLADRELPQSLPFEDLRTFTEVFGRIQKDYVEEVPDDKMLEDAIRGMLSGLDPHSTYLNQEQYQELRVGTTGQFGGLGIEVGMENGFVKVISPIDDTPAQRAGVLAGDLIIRLDEQPVKGMTLGEAVKTMRGEPGKPIILTIVREGEQKPLEITVVRDIIRIQSVKSRILEPDYGYIRITSFQAGTGESLVERLTELKEKNKGNLKGLVLDLRNNPGGVLNAAVAVSDAFLEKGMIVYTEGRIPDSEMEFTATPDDLLEGAPIVVLINTGSASASEIVAGALQDHKRAVIMGERSFGKGSVQTILPTSNGGAVKLTTARYFTPSGRSIQAEGIQPDIKLSAVRLESIDSNGFQPLTEADLSNHLLNDEEIQDQANDAEAVEDGAKLDPTEGAGANSKDILVKEKDENGDPLVATEDYPLYEALNLLKGINILKVSSK